MSWNAYRLVYKALSPVHIGHHKLGFIQRTRYYVTGRNLWGAITASLARSRPSAKIEDYQSFGTKVMNRDVFASYFFSAVEPDKPLLPSYKDGELKYGNMQADVFERNFISSFVQTAIAPSSNTAEDESLHETEFISNFVKDGEQVNPVYFVGYLFIKDDAALDNNGKKEAIGWDSGGIRIKESIKEIFVGGERKYGFGRLVLDKDKKVDTSEKIFDHDCDLSGESVVLKLKPGAAIPGHLKVAAGLSLRGDIEPLVGREWGPAKENKGHGAGQHVSNAEVCWVPGSIAENDMTLNVASCGILEGKK